LESPPSAGGAELEQVLIATAGAIVVTTILLILAIGHRTGRIALLSRIAAFWKGVTGQPGWVVIPTGLIIGSLIIALFGMLWDMSLHIADGRDEGPLANPAHYFILVGLFGVFAAGVLAMVLPRGRTGPTAVRISGDWYVPLGAILLVACGMFSLLGFPLDDVWHRLFGQDVTLWGPTHLMLVGGAAMALLALAVLVVEGDADRGLKGEPLWVGFLRQAALPGAFLLGLSTFQAEFDFGVPQFRFVFQPMLVMLAGGAALVLARVWRGPGAALGAVFFFLLIRGVVALLVGPVLDEPTPYFPLYLAEAVVVELVAFLVPARRPVAFALTCGALIGTVGMAAEWGWSHLFMPIPWPTELLPEAIALGFPMAVAGALLGAWAASQLGARKIPRSPALAPAAALASVLIAGLVGFALFKPPTDGLRGEVTLEEVQPRPKRMVNATVELSPPGAADQAEWFTATAWQGGGFTTEPMRPIGDGSYRTTAPLPVHGDWKAMLRLHNGQALMALPVYFPRDEAIPVAGIPASHRFTRNFVSDTELLQREQKDGISPVVTLGAYGAVLGITAGFLGLFAWALWKVGCEARSRNGAPGR